MLCHEHCYRYFCIFCLSNCNSYLTTVDLCTWSLQWRCTVCVQSNRVVSSSKTGWFAVKNPQILQPRLCTVLCAGKWTGLFVVSVCWVCCCQSAVCCYGVTIVHVRNVSWSMWLHDGVCMSMNVFSTQFTRRPLSVTAPHTWNSLPSDVRSCRTVDTFNLCLYLCVCVDIVPSA